MRIGVIGAGAVGCLFGVRLLQAGHEVHFLMRSDADHVRTHGLTVHSPDGNYTGPVKVHDDPAQMGVMDVVLCALKATALSIAPALVAPCMGPHTRVVVMMNGLGVEAPFVDRFGSARVLGGMSFVGVRRSAPGVIDHTDYGGLTLGTTDDAAAASRSAAQPQTLDELAQQLNVPGISVSIAASLEQARWQKLNWNIPFSCTSVTAGGVTTHELVSDKGLRDICRNLMHETVRAARAVTGCDFDEDQVWQKMLKATQAMGAYKPSMLLDYERKRPLEVEAIAGNPMRAATAAGVAVPHLTMTYHLLRSIDAQRRKGLLR